MPLISRAKATEAQQQLTFLHSLERSYFYTYSRYSDDLVELGFEQATLVTDGGNANYRIEVISADGRWLVCVILYNGAQALNNKQKLSEIRNFSSSKWRNK